MGRTWYPDLDMPTWTRSERTSLRSVARLPVDGEAPDLTGHERLAGPVAPIASGGFGEVWRVHDTRLQTLVALKVLAAAHVDDARLAARFALEARLTASLQHPGIVPVFDVGPLPDGRPAYSMPYLTGRTLAGELEAVDDDPVRLRALIAHIQRTCDAIGYAHRRKNVVHRDLKPANVRLGEHGEVVVIDWGLAAHWSDAAGMAPWALPGGTPGFMPPEQDSDTLDGQGPWTDVYALGQILARAAFDDPRAPARWEPKHPELEPLLDIAERAVHPEPDQRYPDATGLADALRDWLVGVDRRRRALEWVARGDASAKASAKARIDAAALREQADALDIPSWADVEVRRPLWDLTDQADVLERDAARLHADALTSWNAALHQVEKLPQAMDRLADHYRELHEDAERRRDVHAIAESEPPLRLYGARRHRAYLRGRGRLALDTDPTGATVVAQKYHERGRLLVLGGPTTLGTTPLSVRLEHGSYLLTLKSRGRPDVAYPVWIRREHEWSTTPPGADAPEPVWLPHEWPEGTRYVPAGWGVHGGDPRASNSLPWTWHWTSGVFMDTHLATNGEWLAYLESLVADGRRDEADARIPRHRGSTGFHWHAGRLQLGADADGHVWGPDMPVVLVSRPDAEAFAAWRSRQDGRPWRLPREDGWEHAARGADGRHFPWGNLFDPALGCVRDSFPRTGGEPQAIASYPTDVSPYGVRHLAGNVREWCDRQWTEGVPPAMLERHHPIKGSSWINREEQARAAARLWFLPDQRHAGLGFRTVSRAS